MKKIEQIKNKTNEHRKSRNCSRIIVVGGKVRGEKKERGEREKYDVRNRVLTIESNACVDLKKKKKMDS